MDASGKYVRYTNEQVEALERVYHECPKPSSVRRHQLIKESPILANIEPKQIKVWFQNRRYDFFIFNTTIQMGYDAANGCPPIVQSVRSD